MQTLKNSVASLREAHLIRRIPYRYRQEAAIVAISALLISSLAYVLGSASDWATHAFRQQLQHGASLYTLLLTPCGMVLCVWLTRRYFPHTGGSGIAHVRAAGHAPDPAGASYLSLNAALAKMGLVVTGILSGASVGRMGPMVHVGAAVAHRIAGAGRASPDLHRAVMVAGGAAGMAVTFNTPVAGFIFALEVLSLHYDRRTMIRIGLLILLACLGTLLLPRLPGSLDPAVTPAVPVHIWWIIPALGLLCGGIGGYTARLLARGAGRLPGVAGDLARSHPLRFAAACGVLVALLNLLSGGQIHGTGYLEVQQMLATGEAPAAGYGVMKLASTVLSALTGMPGGLLLPALAVGAGIGTELSLLLPWIPAVLLILLGMSGLLAGLVQAPLTAAILVVELTHEPRLLLPLLVTVFIACLISRQIHPTPLFDAQCDALLGPDRPPGKS